MDLLYVVWIPALFNIHLSSTDIYYLVRLAVHKSAAYSACLPAAGKTLNIISDKKVPFLFFF